MSVLVFAENNGGQFKKATFEAVSYAAAVAALSGSELTAIVLGTIAGDALSALGTYGADKVIHISDASLNTFEAHATAKAIAAAAEAAGAKTVVISNNYSGKALAPRLSVKLKAALATGAVAVPTADGNSLTVRRTVFSNKGFADLTLNSDHKIISLTPNSHKLVELNKAGTLSTLPNPVVAADFKAKTVELKKVSGKIPLTEAELVVSAGRGMKGPENWGMIEEMAELLGAATACSKPVSDLHWRGHEEHVGQTGITIKPNLYIAIGISGAIQHLAGVSGSKVIVAINTDKEAPFFKIADYGIVGDALEIVPKLNAAISKFKAAN
jgi:electron transfer flavoprotein alpha subunit